MFSKKLKMFTFYNFTKSKRRFHFPTPKIPKSTLARLGRLPGRVFLRCGVVSGFLSRCCTLQCRENLTLRRSLIQKPPQVKNLLPNCTNCWGPKKSKLRTTIQKHIFSSRKVKSLERRRCSDCCCFSCLQLLVALQETHLRGRREFTASKWSTM